MFEITVLSGKGGTGKTSFTAALASVAENAVFCDNDVDAADLHLIFNPKILEKHTFYGSWTANIDENKCSDCGLCFSNCRFGAIFQNGKGHYEINEFLCEGCRLCERLCPFHAIKSEKSSNNFWYVSDTRFGKLVHAYMGPGEENSGKLVTQVRTKAKEIAKELNADYVLNDGSPGIGCPVIAAVTGTNLVIVVIEPSKSGLHDASRLIELIHTFNIPIVAIINKFDLNPEVSSDIELYLSESKIPLLGKIQFDPVMVEAVVAGKTIVEHSPENDISQIIKQIWQKIKEYSNFEPKKVSNL